MTKKKAKGQKNGQMVVNTLANTKTTKKVAKDGINFQIILNTLEISNLIKYMDKAKYNGTMDSLTKENFFKIN